MSPAVTKSFGVCLKSFRSIDDDKAPGFHSNAEGGNPFWLGTLFTEARP